MSWDKETASDRARTLIARALLRMSSERDDAAADMVFRAFMFGTSDEPAFETIRQYPRLSGFACRADTSEASYLPKDRRIAELVSYLVANGLAQVDGDDLCLTDEGCHWLFRKLHICRGIAIARAQ